MVAHILEELVHEVAIRAMDLDTIESGTVYGVVRGGRVPLDVFLDLCMRSDD